MLEHLFILPAYIPECCFLSCFWSVGLDHEEPSVLAVDMLEPSVLAVDMLENITLENRGRQLRSQLHGRRFLSHIIYSYIYTHTHTHTICSLWCD